MGTKFCPNCGSEDVDLEAGGISGTMVCGDCGFRGSMFPERTFLGDESEVEEDEPKKEKSKTVKKVKKESKTKKKGRKK